MSKKTMIYTDNPNLEFKPIDAELWREYDFLTDIGKVVTHKINEPLVLNVSTSGGHRIIDARGMAHYIPPKWIALRWVNKPGLPRMQF